MKNSKKKSQNKYYEIFTPEELTKTLKIDIKTSKEIILKKRTGNQKAILNFYQKKVFNNNPNFGNKIGLLSKNFNELLGGGFIPGKFYLLYGKFSTAKTQICHNLCVSVFDFYNNMNKSIKTLYIDTEDTFRPERIFDISEKGYYINGTEVLRSVDVLKPKSVSSILFHLNKILRDGLNPKIKLILIDSLTKHIRIDLGDRDISNIQIRKRLKKILEILFEIKAKYGIPIIITSQVTSLPSNSSSFSVKPVMGYLLNEYVDESILLSHNEKGDRFGYLVNSTFLPEMNIEFHISQRGIIDVN